MIIVVLAFFDVLHRAATWPRRKLRAIGYQAEYEKAQLRALVAELDTRPWMDRGPTAAPAATSRYGTWTLHRDPFAGWDDPGPWTDGLLSRVRSAPSVLDTGARPLTAEDWEVLYDSPEYARCLAAEQAALDRQLEAMTAAWHHQQQRRGQL